ncbi:PEP phosphonomutase [Streptomyces venezuelae]|uniref:isocitrate lyase/PEP mutase family protein n=1 Tax=Streptomyces gardneri TaxID=66892 RepID=UPI0006BD62EB|nr:isocitrate lyase/phosphoenolpyruvate mutase family protein [Streptomyces gardneri]ALO06145.1 PEP phosphonomutase [Streptomyces venezuelae]QPK43622.1 isocitrate lyase/phosphoenolpyruvate mutase family protein [Streptomyces gardneri]WRK34870.1 isocitrate lyase/phosphoenolpyruvate mutase family protein [Streptomyces venezuelae]CUM43612.1 Probable carboxyvinyl-carboxyphosphonate phosphorylmutase [Streptomyces venezuelae]
MTNLVEKARLFRSLHVPGKPLVLPNAWDAASARVVAEVGAPAVATTSAGVAWSLGHGDGDHLSRDEALGAVARITAAVDVPVTADIERGYAADPEGVAETVRGVLAAGAVGINLEDSLRPVAEQVERIAAARRAADEAGVPLFLNARIDTHRMPSGDPAAWLEETLVRARAYAAAGADGIFVLSGLDTATIGLLVDGSPLPVNLVAGPGALPVPALAEAGVARVSAGSSIAEAAYGLVRRAARELLAQGTTGALEGGFDYATLNELLLADRTR